MNTLCVSIQVIFSVLTEKGVSLTGFTVNADSLKNYSNITGSSMNPFRELLGIKGVIFNCT